MGSIQDLNAMRDPETRRRMQLARIGRLPGETEETVLESSQLAQPRKCGLYVRIDGRSYKATIENEGRDGADRIVRLRNTRGGSYHVARRAGSIACNCPDHAIRGKRCGHIAAVVALGLLATR